MLFNTFWASKKYEKNLQVIDWKKNKDEITTG